jgi:chromosome segregation ATPase
MIACSSQRAPAEQAVAGIDTALSAIHDSAATYLPDRLHTVDEQVTALKGNLAQGNYKEVLDAAPATNAAVASLAEDVRAKQAAADSALAQTKQQWRTLSEEVPKLVASVHSQLDTLSKTRKLPKGVTKAAVESAMERAASLDSTWAEATSTLAKDDNYASAVAKGQSVKDNATELLRTLGVKSS